MSDTPQSPELNPRDAELLSAYLDEMLSDNEARNLEARLQREPQLRNHLRYLRQTVTLLNNLPQLNAPRDFTLTEEMLSRRRGSSQTPDTAASNRPSNDDTGSSQNGRSGSGWPLWSGLAAVVSVVLVGVLLVVNQGAGGSTGDSQQIAQAPTQAAEEGFSAVDETGATEAIATIADVSDTRLTATSMALALQATATPTTDSPAVSAPPASDADMDAETAGDDAVELQSERGAAMSPPESDSAADVMPQSAQAAEAESDESFDGMEPGMEPESLSTAVSPAGAEGARFEYTPTPFSTPAPADLRNPADEMAPASDADSADNLAETGIIEAPQADGGSVERGLAVPDAPTVQPGINSQVLRVIRWVLDALRVLLSWSGCAIC